MNDRIRTIASFILVGAGAILVITGIGGGGFDFTTGEWFINTRTTPTENRIIGGLLIVFGVLLSRLKHRQ